MSPDLAPKGDQRWLGLVLLLRVLAGLFAAIWLVSGVAMTWDAWSRSGALMALVTGAASAVFVAAAAWAFRWLGRRYAALKALPRNN